MYAISWILAGMLAAVAGILLAPTLFLSTGMGSIVFIAIVATIVGGFGNIFGAIIGGYILGILQTILPLYIPTELQGLIPFVLLMLVLFIKPTGLLGKSTKMKV
jgi:branched-chain amino acid transport system permease protein